MAPSLFLTLATAVNLVCAIFSLVIWYSAYRAFRFLGSTKMLLLSASFLLFSLGLLTQTFYALAAMVGNISFSRLLLGEGYLLYSILMFAGYVLLAFTYSIGEAAAGASTLIPFRPNPISSAAKFFSDFRMFFLYGVQALSAALLAYVLAKVYHEYFSKKASYALPIAVGLTLLLIQLLVRIFYLDSALDYVFASVIQLGGFALIFYAVWRVSR